MGLDYAGIQKWAGNRAVVQPGYEPYALSPVVRWPLVRRSDGLYVAPVAGDLLDRPTRGFTIDVQQSVPVEETDVVNSSTADIYEDYVERLLGTSIGTNKIKRGKEILPTDRPNCDFVCIEEGAATLIEVKSGRFSLLADMTKDFDLLREEIVKRGVSHGLAQLDASARAIRARETALPRNVLLCGLLVVRGEQVWLNSPIVRELLEDLMFEETGRRIFIKYQLINDEGLESLSRLLAESPGLCSLLQKKDKATRAEDFEDTIARLAPSRSQPLLINEQHDELTRLLGEFGFRPPTSGAQGPTPAPRA